MKTSLKVLFLIAFNIAIKQNLATCQDLAYTENRHSIEKNNEDNTSFLPVGITANTIYKIKNQVSGKALEVKFASPESGSQVWQNDLNEGKSEQFTFVPLGNDLFNIITNAGLYLSLKSNIMNSTGSGTASPRILVQDTKYMQSMACNMSVTANCPMHQTWRLVPTGANGSYFIESAAFSNPSYVLQPADNNAQSAILLSAKTGAENQKWIVAELGDLMLSPNATQAELSEFKDIMANQMGVAVLGGETTKPFYFHNQPQSTFYKYPKIIDPTRLPGAGLDKIKGYLGSFGIVLSPLSKAFEIVGDIKDWLFGSNSTKMAMDCWYPDSEFKKTACGKLKEDAFVCAPDFLHTQVTDDRDINLDIFPNDKFKFMLRNRHIGDKFTSIEGEVKPKMLRNVYNDKTGESRTPRNASFLELKKDANVCLFGPWMGDILDINAKIPLPLTDTKIEVANIDLRNNNEIHPVNQLWYKKGAETQLISVVDATGYFNKTGNNEIAASGLNQLMRYYVAFEIPASIVQATQAGKRVEYDVNGIGFDFTNNSTLDIQPEFLTLKYNGQLRLKINDNSFVRLQKTHKVFFDKIRNRSDGSVQGYFVVETERITNQGGSINVIIKNTIF